MLQSMRASAKYIFWFIAITFVGGFLLAETSGLLGRAAITPTTPVAVVNGTEITWRAWQDRVQNQVQQVQRQGRSLSADEVRQVENQAFDEMVNEVLLEQEYRRRGIVVSDDELRLYAKQAPPPWLRQNPDLLTDGQFDPSKYERLLASPQARQSGLLVALEQYYRQEIPKAKLFDNVTTGVWITDEELWRTWRDLNDSAVVSFVAFRPAPGLKPDASISDSDLRAYYEQHKDQLRQSGRAVLSVLEIRREVTAADSAAVRAKAERLRQEIEGGAKFEDVAKRESADSASAVNGGDLGRGARGRFVPAFETAAYALQPGQVSQPVLSQFGYHLIKVDEKKGDTLALRHILLPIQPSDANSAAIDRRADELSRLAANADQPAKFDAAAKQLNLPVEKVIAQEGEPAVFEGRIIPSVSAWAFGGAKIGEASELYDTDAGYVVARLDSLQESSEGNFDAVKDEVRMLVTQERAVAKLVPQAQQLAKAAVASTLEQAATAQKLTVEKTEPFTRATGAPGLGRLNEAVGAAFGLPVNAVSAPVVTEGAVFVMRVDRRTQADRKTWEGTKGLTRQQRINQLREQRLQLYLQELRKSAKVDDRRKKINAMVRRGTET